MFTFLAKYCCLPKDLNLGSSSHFVQGKYFQGSGGTKDVLILNKRHICFIIESESPKENRKRHNFFTMWTNDFHCHFHVPCKIISVPINQSGEVIMCGDNKHRQYFRGLNIIQVDSPFMLYVHWGWAGLTLFIGVTQGHPRHPPFNLNTIRDLEGSHVGCCMPWPGSNMVISTLNSVASINQLLPSAPPCPAQPHERAKNAILLL